MSPKYWHLIFEKKGPKLISRPPKWPPLRIKCLPLYSISFNVKTTCSFIFFFTVSQYVIKIFQLDLSWWTTLCIYAYLFLQLYFSAKVYLLSVVLRINLKLIQTWGIVIRNVSDVSSSTTRDQHRYHVLYLSPALHAFLHQGRTTFASTHMSARAEKYAGLAIRTNYAFLDLQQRE